MTRNKPEFREDEYHLYKNYSETWHKSDSVLDEQKYTQLYVLSPVDSEILRYELHGKLLGCSYIDILPDSISSVYFTFDPDERKRGLGKYSVLYEIELCRSLKKNWYQIGYYVKECRKMRYKAEYKPHQFLINGKWED